MELVQAASNLVAGHACFSDGADSTTLVVEPPVLVAA